ncbi:hypothetical protein K227x_62380 [Rubripirellula lacrimiformis]|uniref:Uncharacterized protein n=1 Tax=Rubripirellula lacrimiformis TaxID=1930273 RepID=A0A517NL03_9BACT|nr:hypothetical protein K227x_62380 [Rubripirellula lacrimiformis]
MRPDDSPERMPADQLRSKFIRLTEAAARVVRAHEEGTLAPQDDSVSIQRLRDALTGERPEASSESQTVERAFEYKCRVCGETHHGPVGSFSLSDGQVVLMTVLDSGVCHRPGAAVSKESFHNCQDGSLGVSDIIGVVEAK